MFTAEPYMSSEIAYRRERVAADYRAASRSRGSRRWRLSKHPRVPEQRTGDELTA